MIERERESEEEGGRETTEKEKAEKLEGRKEKK